jgi:hypothetical protein
MTVCADQKDGRVFITACPICSEKKKENDKVKQEEKELEKKCKTFREINLAPGERQKCSGRMSFYDPASAAIVTFGGFNVDPGENFSYAHCSFDLQEYTHNVPAAAAGGGGGEQVSQQLHYKSGHSHIKTSLGYLMVRKLRLKLFW